MSDKKWQIQLCLLGLGHGHKSDANILVSKEQMKKFRQKILSYVENEMHIETLPNNEGSIVATDQVRC
jgi:hypothetical protein